MTESKSNWIGGLESIRFVLAFIVMISHFHNPIIIQLKQSPNAINRLLGSLINNLFCGAGAVTAFFIISGFVIHFPNRHKEGLNVPKFLLRRWLRIGIPMVVISITASFFGEFSKLPLWSLYCELAYYTLYPLLFASKRTWKQKLFISYMASILFIGLFALNIYFQQRHLFNIHLTATAFDIWLVIVSLPIWLLGVLLAHKIDVIRYEINTRKIWISRFSIFVLSILFLILKTKFHVRYSYSQILFAIPAYKWIETEIVYYRTHIASRTMEYLGRFSYSLYLCHTLCYYFISLMVPETSTCYFVFIIGTLLLSYTVYLLVEHPAHRLARYLGREFQAS